MLKENSISAPIEFGLRLIGLWPNYTYAIFHRLLWTIAMIFVLIFEYVYVLTHIKTDELPDLMDSLTITLSNSLLFIKLIILWFNDRTLEDILTTIMNDYDNNEGTNDRIRMRNKVIISRRFASCTIILYSTTVVIFSISVIFAPERVQVLKMELPFDSMRSPIYEFVSIFQFLQELIFASTSGLLNGLIVTLMLHLGGQAEIMCQRLGDVSLEIINGKGTSCKDSLRSLIDSHQRIIHFSVCVESVFNSIALIQFLSNTLAICFSGFVIITSFDSDQGSVILAKTLPYYTVVNLEAFVLCFAGEYLTSKGKAIGEAAYTCTWYELRPNESRYFLLLILRSQKRLTITIGKFMDLSLECFASILHTGGQVDIMRRKIEEFMNRLDNERCVLISALKKLIIEHDRIILFSGYIDDLFNHIALLQFLSNTMAICFSGFVIMTSIGTEEGNAILAKTVPYYTVVNVEAFILCFAGEYLSSKSVIIGEMAYDIDWYELKPNESRYILLLIIRAQKKLTITVGKFLDLSLESFASILKTSASYASVLHAMY